MTHREPWRVSTKNGLDSDKAAQLQSVGLELIVRLALQHD